MCGIVGHISLRLIDQKTIAKELNLIKHRGPDDSGYWFNYNKNIVLGSVRLAIQDLSPLGKMPMHDDANNVHIVLNGEIYNFQEIRNELMNLGYSFRSGSDTEVILKGYLAYGIQILDKLNGMFAFAILDERINKVFLARDRFGEKPLYYWKHKTEFGFASELKVYLEDDSHSKHINYEALGEYLQYGYINSKHSILSECQQVSPGSYLEINTLDLSYSQHLYWSKPKLALSSTPLSEAICLEEIEKLLQNSISRQLIADVPVGIFLSGGVDSSLITAIAVQQSAKQVNTYHISMKDSPNIDERKYADYVAQKFGTKHTVLTADELTFDDFIAIISTLDQPMADSSYIPTYMISKLARPYTKVVLGGDGGDELFGGYAHYKLLLDIENRSFWDKIPFSWIENLPNFRGKGFFLNKKKENFINGFKWFFSITESKKIFNHTIPHRLNFNKLPKIDFTSQASIIESVIHFDLENYLCDDILTKVDRAAMFNSLETRSPFLDKELSEFALSQIPANLKITEDRIQKYLLKKLLSKKIPDLNVNRKQGFSIPLTQWIIKWESKLIAYINSFNESELNTNYLIHLVKNVHKGQGNTYKAYNMLVLMIWKQKYKISIFS